MNWLVAVNYRDINTIFKFPTKELAKEFIAEVKSREVFTKAEFMIAEEKDDELPRVRRMERASGKAS